MREVLAAYLRRVRGAVAPAEQIVVCGGFGQGINLVLRSLAQDGVRRAGIEDPGDNDYQLIAARLTMLSLRSPRQRSGALRHSRCHMVARRVPLGCQVSRPGARSDPGWPGTMAVRSDRDLD